MLCTICQSEFSPEESETMPFCSHRCKLIDLGRWLDEGYSLPTFPDPEDDETPPEWN